MSKHKDLVAQDSHGPSQDRVENNSGSAIVAFRLVKYVGIGTNFPEISISEPGDDVRGITYAEIPDGNSGYILVYGLLYNIDTSSWAPGTSLYCGTGGVLTDVSNGPQVANVLKQDSALGVIQLTCLDTPAALTASVQDSDSIDLDTVGNIIKGDLRLSSAAASAGNMKATTTIKGTPNQGLHVEYPFASGSQDGILESIDWNTFNNKVDQADARFSIQNQVRVKLNPGTGEFSSIASALASITTASASNPFLISVGPGIYTEPQLVMKPYVFIEGAEQDQTIIETDSPNQHAILGADNSGISKCKINGSTGSGFAAIYYASSASYSRQTFFVRQVRFGNNDTLAICDSSTAITILFIDSCMFGQQQFNRGFVAQGSNVCAIGIRNTTTWGGLVPPFPTDIFLANSSTANFLLEGVAVNTNTTSGNAVHVVNGGGVRAVGCYLKGFAKAVWAENSGSAPNVTLSGTVFEGNTVNLQIDHPGTTGFFTGFSEYLKTNINPSAPFFVTNKDLNVITVGAKGADFNSIASAVAAAQAESPNPTNQFLISVGPGLYSEPQINLGSYITLQGSINSTIVVPQDPTDHLIVAEAASTIIGLTLTGVTGVGKAALYVAKANVQIDQLAFGSNTIGILVEGVTEATTLLFNTCTFGGIFVNAIAGINSGQPVTIVGSGLAIDGTLATGDIISLTNSTMALGTSAMQGSSSINGIVLKDGANLSGSGIALRSFNKALYIENTGAASNIAIEAYTFQGNVTDIHVEHPGALGSIAATAQEELCIFATPGNISLLLLDPDGHIVTGGTIKNQQPDGTFTDTTTLATQSTPMGLLSSGDMNPPISGLDLIIEAGKGYLQKADKSLRLIEWTDTIISIPSNSEGYIYFDDTSTLQFNVSKPLETENILIGRVVTNSTDFEIIEESGFAATHASNSIGKALRNGLGPIYASGSIVTEVGTRTLAVTAGSYYFGERNFLTSGGSPITFTSYYRDGSGGITRILGQTVVDNAFYDDGSGTLASISSGDYVKHSLYALGDSTGDFDSEKYFLVYGQAQFTALTLAEQGSLPTPPGFLSDAVVHIASIIVKQGTTTIVEIRDERPIVGFKSSGVSASTFHSGLLGLTVGDDHPQYFRNDGTHSMTADLNVGGFSVINVNLVDGVKVSAHASRHLPNGSDPETTAAPLIPIGGNTSNGVGTANSFARSDHQHALATGTPSTITPDQSNAAGTSNNIARADHIHNIPSDVAVGINANSTNTQGSGTAFARNDHTHAIATGAVSSQTPDQVNAAGTSTNLSRADHIHNIATAAPVTINSDGSNNQGVASTFSRSDHKHNISVGTPATQTPDQSNAAGTSSSLSRADHIHNIPADAPVTTLSPATSNAEGTGTSFARNDHTHAIATALVTDLTTIQPDASAAAGTVDRFARADHRHAIVADAPTTTLSPATSNAEGTGTSFARNDHTHAIATALVADISTIQPDDTASAGTASTFARGDHKHAIVADTAVSISTSSANAEGTSTSFARADHTHAVSITNSRVASTTLITTTSPTYVVMTGQTLTPATGTYYVMARSNFSATSNGRILNFAIFLNGSIVADTETITRVSTGNASFGGGDVHCLFTEAFITVNGSQAIDMRWNTNGGTAQAQGYSLALLKVS